MQLRANILSAIACFSILTFAGSAAARDLFTATISIGGGPATTLSTNKARKLPEFFDDATLSQIEPGYDPTQAVFAAIDLRGLRGQLSFNASSNTLRLRVPKADIDVSFPAASRGQAQEQLEDWLAGDFGSTFAPAGGVTKLLQALVANSPVDPVAGNPNSLQARMFDADYRIGVEGSVARYGEGGIIPSLFRFQSGGGVYNADDFDVFAIDVPVRFGVSLGDRLGVVADVPTTFTSTEGAWSGMSSAGVGIRISPIEGWTLTPTGRIGGVGSLDLGGLAAMGSGSLTSHLRMNLGPVALGMGNMFGFAKTIDGIEVSGYSLDYDLLNYNLRNGVYVEGSFGSELLGTGFGWRTGVSDVRFFGDELFLESYQEIGAAVSAGLPIGGVQADVAYLVGRDYQGFSGRVGLRF